jgi:hypothetical protein
MIVVRKDAHLVVIHPIMKIALKAMAGRLRRRPVGAAPGCILDTVGYMLAASDC